MYRRSHPFILLALLALIVGSIWWSHVKPPKTRGDIGAARARFVALAKAGVLLSPEQVNELTSTFFDGFEVGDLADECVNILATAQEGWNGRGIKEYSWWVPVQKPPNPDGTKLVCSIDVDVKSRRIVDVRASYTID